MPEISVAKLIDEMPEAFVSDTAMSREVSRAVLPWIALDGHDNYILYVLVGPLIAVNQFVLAQHKPGWINTPFDVATIPAGFAVVAPIAFF